ncbi:interaptin [Plutella xylostella]|uniref:interaptin n=1 Tax=Plutella xylostella TaxID=51655 RepID=UPI0020324BE8|nr:interaptin [Plutella xylostella]
MELDTARQEKLNILRKPAVVAEDLTRARRVAELERIQREKLEKKVNELEDKLNSICSAEPVAESKEQRKLEAENSSLKSQIRDLKDEIEELKLNAEQLQDYRNKYLQAQQEAMEYKRQLEVLDYDNRQVSEQVQIEIQKMKMQFQEKLMELSPLPDLLKNAQIQLQEAKQLQDLAEDSSRQLSAELQRVNEKLIIAINNYTHEKAEKHQILEENKTLTAELEEKENEIVQLNKLIEESKYTITRLEERLSNLDQRFREKSSEVNQVMRDLEDLKSESHRSLLRSKERSETTRRQLQAQVSELERQLSESRAQCRASQRERDEARQRILMQVNNLKENYDLVEIRLRTLQQEVTSLKTNYSSIMLDDEENPAISLYRES